MISSFRYYIKKEILYFVLTVVLYCLYILYIINTVILLNDGNFICKFQELSQEILVSGAGFILVKLVYFMTQLSLCMRKPTIWVSDLVRHKPGCTVTEDG